jgi:hypothetical protein
MKGFGTGISNSERHRRTHLALRAHHTRRRLSVHCHLNPLIPFSLQSREIRQQHHLETMDPRRPSKLFFRHPNILLGQFLLLP